MTVSKEYGSLLGINPLWEKRLVTPESEIGKGNYLYLTNPKSQSVVWINYLEYNKLVSGDLSDYKNLIEKSIKGTTVTWMHVQWDKTSGGLNSLGQVGLGGFKIEIVVKNNDAGLTGLEIAGIIIAVGFLVSIVVAVAISAWIAYEIVTTTNQIGPSATIVVGIILLVLIGFFVYLMFGGKAKYKGNGKSVIIGK